MFSAPAAAAQDTERRFELHIAESTLGAALGALAEQTGAQLLYPYDLAQSRGMNPVEGRYTVAEALDEMLRGTPFSGGLTASGVITISRANAANALGEKAMASGRKGRLLAGLSALAVGVAGASAVPTGSAHAKVDEIIVTAQKRSESIQDVPMSVAAYSGRFIEQGGFNDINDLGRFIPNFSMESTNTMRNTTVRIRGIGSPGSNPGIESSVGMFLDGVYMPSAGQIFGELMDVATVEVLRGPQGTLYGRNTPIGAVNITTKKPSQEFEATVRGGGGNYDLRHASAVVGGGLAPEVSARATAWIRDRSGYDENLATGDWVNDGHEYGARTKLLWTPGEDVEVLATGFYSHSNADCCVADILNPFGRYYLIGGTGNVAYNYLGTSAADGFIFKNFEEGDHKVQDAEVGLDESETWGVSATVDWSIFGDHTLTSITAYQRWESVLTHFTTDHLPQDTVTSDQVQRNDTWSEELRIASPTGNLFDYLGGIFLYKQDTLYTTNTAALNGNTRWFSTGLITPGDRGATFFDQTTKAWAAFGTLTLNATDKWSITGGLRYSQDKKNAYITHNNQPGVSAAWLAAFPTNIVGHLKRSESHLTWSANTRYRWTPNFMTFVSAATGLKTGGFNSRRQAVGAPVEFEEETSISYEAGFKSTLFDDRLQLNVTAYHTTLSDFQESTVNPLTNVGFIVGNAGEREVKGVELEFSAVPTDEIELFGALAYMKAEFTDRPDGQCPPGFIRTPDGSKPNSCNFTGSTPEKSPEWQVSLGGQWTKPLPNTSLSYFLRADASYTSEHYQTVELDPRSIQDGYTLVNLRTGIQAQDGKWNITAWVKNLTDEAYTIDRANQPLGGFVRASDPPNAANQAAIGFVGFYGPPRTLGIEATIHF
ncbi:MAG: TonB-dependent receptor [Alphaproteobacteria bacterium]|nr:TonB-dependent receptor [Alphaproteobacteria bacterium]